MEGKPPSFWEIERAFQELKARIGEEDAEYLVAVFTELIPVDILSEYEFLSLLGLM